MLQQGCGDGMTLNKYLSVVIGRFQPLTKGHTALFLKALEGGPTDLLVIVGSANVSCSIKNPFTAGERIGMIRDYFLSDFAKDAQDNDLPIHFPFTVTVACVDESDYDYDWWKAAVRETVVTVAEGRDPVLYGHLRDATSYYLCDCADFIPGGRYREVPPLADDVSATKVRGVFFRGIQPVDKSGLFAVSPSCEKFLIDFMRNMHDTFPMLCKEASRIEAYKKSWASSPYPPNHVTVDATVFWNKPLWAGASAYWHVLLIKRKDNGLWAVPGGFLNTDETLKRGVLRELEEETGISGVFDDMKLDPKCVHVFDAPDRDLRGRVITHNFAWVVDKDIMPPVPKAADDAEDATWKALDWVRAHPTRFYADHFKMLNVMAQKCGLLQPRVPVIVTQEITVNAEG